MNQNEYLESMKEKKRILSTKISKLQKQLERLEEAENHYIAAQVKELMKKNNITLNELSQLLSTGDDSSNEADQDEGQIQEREEHEEHE